MTRPPAFFALVLVALAGCNQVRDGFAPVLGDDVTAAEKERFARRLYLDLTGLPATAEQTQAVVDRLDQDGNSAATRDALAAELVAAPAMGQLYVSETESAALSGQSLEYGYTFLCAIVQGTDAACLSCSDPDPCACQCAALEALGAERQGIRDLAADLAAGAATTGEYERALARSGPFAFNGTSPEGIAMQLFEAFLARPAEPDEIKNARFMTIGSLLPDSPAGLLFHRHGKNFDDLLDIVFESEVYRDALVTRVFQRYLGRRPSGDELRHFSGSLDPAAPDMRPVVRAVVASAEYFHQ
jgi:hypothetical protein